MRILITIYLSLASIGCLFSQYEINFVHSANGAICDGFVVFNVSGDTEKFELTLYHKEPDANQYNIVHEKQNHAGTGYFKDLCQGKYTLKVEDSFGCKKNLTFEVEGCTEIELIREPYGETPTSCLDNGWILFGTTEPGIHHFSGLEGDVEFFWSNGETGPRIEDLASGAYTVTVVDSRGCDEEFTFEWFEDESTKPIVNTLIEQSCGTENVGYILISAYPPEGMPNQSFIFKRLDTGEEFVGNAFVYEDLAPGFYYFLITDLDGNCPIELSLEVEEINADEPLNFTIVPATLSCPNDDRGTAEINIVGGVPPFSVESSIGGGNFIDTEYAIVANLSSGTQLITVTDFCENTWSEEITIEEHEALTVGITSKGFQNCDPNKGRIVFNADANFSVRFYGELYNSIHSEYYGTYSHTFNNLDAGPHNFVVYDENGCNYDFYNTTIEDPINTPTELKIVMNPSTISCESDNPGIWPVVTGGTPPYSFHWKKGRHHGSSVYYSSEEELNDPPHDYYILAVTDACLNHADILIDYRCLCVYDPQFDYWVFDPCHDELLNIYRIGISADETVNTGQYDFEWISPLSGAQATLIVDRDGDMHWSGTTHETRPDQGTFFNIQVSDPRGCVYNFTHTANSDEITDIVFPLENSNVDADENRLSHWTQEESDEEFVSHYCWTHQQCNGVPQNEGDFVRVEYVPDNLLDPCSSGWLKCPNDEFEQYRINVEGLPISINRGPDKCGCLWNEEYLLGLPFYDGHRVLGIFDCDGDDVTIDITGTIFPDGPPCDNLNMEEILGEECRFNVECVQDGQVVGTAPNEFIGDGICKIDLKCPAVGRDQVLLVQYCDIPTECHLRYDIIPYTDAGGIPTDDFVHLRDNNLCHTIDNPYYRLLCYDESEFDFCTDSDQCLDWFVGQYCVGLWESPSASSRAGGGTSSTIQLTPNPTSGAVNIAFQKIHGEDSYQIQIKDVHGRSIWQGNIQSSLDQITTSVEEVSQFQSGVYFVIVTGQTTQENLVARLVVN